MAVHTPEELNKVSKSELIQMLIASETKLDEMNEKLDHLLEQIRIANAQRFGRHTEKLDQIDGQLSFFNECEYLSEEAGEEPKPEEVIPPKKRPKKKGQRQADLSDFPHEKFSHTIGCQKLDAFYGKGCWRQLPSETYQRLRFRPATWLVEDHTVEVFVGTDGDHQDEFMRAPHPKSLLRNSIVTPSLEAAVMNAKYVNSVPINRIEQEFQRNGVNISRQTMANWTILCADKYFTPLYEKLKKILLSLHVNQADETPVRVIHTGDEGRSKSYMWVHRSGEFYRDRQIVLYEYQNSRHHKHPEAFYKDFKGVLVTDGLQQYHMLERLIPGITSSNCWAHARRDYADAIKGNKSLDDNKAGLRTTVAEQALTKIAAIYKLEKTFKDLSPEDRLRRRQESILPLVDAYFAWVKEILKEGIISGKTADGLNYSLNQEKYLRVFLTDGEVPIDNSASERSIRTFCVGKKSWVLINSVKGAEASASIYSITETAKLNDLNPYYYLEYLLERMPYLVDLKEEDMDTALEELLPWSDSLPEKCHKKRR